MKSVLLIGLDPEVVDFSKWPQLTKASLTQGINLQIDSIKKLGFQAKSCLTDTGKTAEQVVKNELAKKQYDIIMIGAGIRKDDTYFLLFEKLINVVHALAPKAKICFNNLPSDSLEALKRWI